MAEQVTLNTYPENKFEALTMLYLQTQDLSGLTPEELLEKYYDVYGKMRDHNKAAYSAYKNRNSTE